MPGGLNHESTGLSETSKRPLASSAPGVKYELKRGCDGSAEISVSWPPCCMTRKILIFALSNRATIRLRPEGSTTAPSPAQIFCAAPPAEGIDQMVPPAEK